MKKVTLILALFFGFIPMLTAQWISPGDGTTYTLTDLAEIGCVHHDYANSVYSIMTDITISATDRLYIYGNDEPNSLLFNENDLTLTIKGAMVVEGTEDSHYYIGMPVYAEHGRKVTILFSVENFPGILSQIINIISSYRANILTINQNIPINGLADISISFDMGSILGSVEDIISDIGKITGVRNCSILSRE